MKMTKTAALTLAGFLLASLLAAQTPRGAEIRVNTLPATQPWPPQVAIAPSGDFIVVWGTGEWRDPPTEIPHVWARFFRADGTPKTKQLRVSPSPAPEILPRVAAGGDGSFVVVWEGGPFQNSGVFGRRFDADGGYLGARFPLNSNPVGRQSEPAVAVGADGGFVATWTTSGLSDEDLLNVHARRFDAAGQPLGAEFPVNVTTFDEQESSQVAMDASGDFVIGWLSYGGEETFFDVYARCFAANGVPKGDEFQANLGGFQPASQDEFALGMAPDGSIVVLWTDYMSDSFQDLPNGLLGQRFTAGGQPAGPTFQVSNSPYTVQSHSAIAMMADGGFFAVWSSYPARPAPPPGQPPGQPARSSIVGRRFASDGKARGREIRIDRSPLGGKGLPAVALSGDGRGLAVWWQKDGIAARRLVP